jgi:hypothetical protein
MNHYDPLIQDYLAQYKSVSLEKIGHINIEGATGGESAVTFHYEKRAETTPELITFISERTGKNRLLIESDLASHFELTRQFINIGKPYELEGFGFISLSRTGEYTFAPYDSAEGKEEHRASKKKQHAYADIHAEQKRSSRGFLMFIAFLIIVGVLGVIGWGTYKLFIDKGISSINDTISTGNTITTIDTAANADAGANSKDTLLSKDTITTVKVDSGIVAKNDTSAYKFIFERTSSLDHATNRTDELRIILSPDASFDSVKADSFTIYRLYLKLNLPASDTIRMKDSLQKYFRHSIKIVRSS